MDQITALQGIRVVEMTQAMAGPLSAMTLGDLGAEVIKVERPGSGDQSRAWGPPFLDGESAYFMCVNRNKRSVVLDLKTEGGRAAMHRLLERADVFLVNLPREDQRRANGVDWETLHALNPRLIYALISGYGATGPDADRPGYDQIAQGLSGLMSLTGEPGMPPIAYPLPIADIVTGLYTVIAVEAALLARRHTGRGQFLDLSLQSSQLTLLTNASATYFATDRLPARLGNAHQNIVPYGVFEAQDGYMIVGVATASLWSAFCRALDAGWMEHDPRFAANADRVLHRAELTQTINDLLGQRERAHWLETLDRAGIPCGPILDVAQALSHPQILHRGLIVEQEHPTAGTIHSVGNPILFSGTPVSYRRSPPRMGEHTKEVLRWLGYDEDEIERLRQEGAVSG